MKYHQGIFTPIHPEKYKGRKDEIVYRSGWEKRFMVWCDSNPSILEWSSEEIQVPYLCGTDNKLHRYFPDFLITVRAKDGSTKTYMVEVKPRAQRLPPSKKSKNYLNEALTFIKNKSKWTYAKEYCRTRGWKFMVIDETDLGIS